MTPTEPGKPSLAGRPHRTEGGDVMLAQLYSHLRHVHAGRRGREA